MRWCHDQTTKGPPSAVHQHASQSNERLARATLRDDVGVTRDLPALAYTHDRQGLRRVWVAQHSSKQGRKIIVGALQRRVRLQDSLAQFRGVHLRVRGYVVRDL